MTEISTTATKSLHQPIGDSTPRLKTREGAGRPSPWPDGDSERDQPSWYWDRKIPYADPRPMLGRINDKWVIAIKSEFDPEPKQGSYLPYRLEIVRCQRGRCRSKHAAKPYLLGDRTNASIRARVAGSIGPFTVKADAVWSGHPDQIEDEIPIIDGDVRLDRIVAAVGVVAFMQDRLNLIHVDVIEKIALAEGERKHDVRAQPARQVRSRAAAACRFSGSNERGTAAR